MTTGFTTGTPPAAASTTVAAYWLVASDGGIFSFGGAPFYGSTGGIVLNKPIVGMAAVGNPSPRSTAGDTGSSPRTAGSSPTATREFYGSTGSMTLNKPIVGMASTPDGKGYWLVASDGGIFSYGDAQFYGSTGAMKLNQPVVGMASTPDGKGYWLVASDGGIFSYGDAQFYGSTGSIVLNKPIIGHDRRARTGTVTSSSPPTAASSATATPLLRLPGRTAAQAPRRGGGPRHRTGDGYWFTDTSGLVSNFGDAHYYGSAPSPLNKPIVGMADAPGNGSFVGGTYPSGSYGYDISTYQCGNLPTGDHQIGIVQVDGSSSGNTNPCLAQEASWAGGGLNLYTYLTYGTSTTPEPGCNGDTSCNAGYQAGIARLHATPRTSARAQRPFRGGSTSRPPTPTGRAT